MRTWPPARGRGAARSRSAVLGASVMPTLVVDGRSASVPDGATILDAAKAAGIEIPTLCYYPQLPIVGNCRICLVSVEGRAKLVPACAAKAADGMVVTTESQAAVKSRRGGLAMLLE